MGYYAADTGESLAEFEYGPFGELIRATGSKEDAFNFRFSTKYQDAETELFFYGFRYYDAETGRWLNRDPIGENGGLNLYGMVGNDAVNAWDYLGKEPLTPQLVEDFIEVWGNNKTFDDTEYMIEFFGKNKALYDGVKDAKSTIDGNVKLAALVTVLITDQNQEALEALVLHVGEKQFSKALDKATKGNPALGFIFDASVGFGTGAGAFLADQIELRIAESNYNVCNQAYISNYFGDIVGPYTAGRGGKVECFATCEGKIYAKATFRSNPTLATDSLPESIVKTFFNDGSTVWYTK